MTAKVDWAFVRDRGGIAGVRSSSTLEPLKKAGFPERYRWFEGKTSYAEWVFVISYS